MHTDTTNIECVPLEGVIAEIEISYKPSIKVSRLPVVYASQDAYHFFLETWDKTKLEFVEQGRLMLLNHANRVLGICTISTGSNTQTVVDKKLILGIALKANVSKIIIAHNHPSGLLRPSMQDRTLTEALLKACVVMDIEFADHLIITTEDYYSFADEGAL